MLSLRQLKFKSGFGTTKKWISYCCPPVCCKPCINKKYKVVILGGNGKVGSTLAFLLKQSAYVDIIALYDVANPLGTAMDIAHIDTKCRVQAYTGPLQLGNALFRADVIVMAAGAPRSPCMSHQDLFETNAPIVKCLAEECARNNPKALMCVLTNPINSMVPLVAQVYRGECQFDPAKVFGITAVDGMRASCIVTRDILGEMGDPGQFLVPMVGGHSAQTTIPVLSQVTPCMVIDEELWKSLIEKVQQASSVVVNLKGDGGPVLSAALAAHRFIENLLRALRGEENIMEQAYISTTNVPDVNYCVSAVKLGRCGVIQNPGLVKMTSVEKVYLQRAVKHLLCDIRLGESYVSRK